MIDEDLLRDDAVFRVGRVTAVEGRRVRITVDKMKNGSHLIYKGGIVRNVAVGSYVKIVKGFTEMIAKVDGESVREDPGASADYSRAVDRVARSLQVSLVGFVTAGRFERGIRELPLLDNECFILTENEFESIHQFVGREVPALQIGVLATEPTQKVRVGVDAIFASHVGIFGNTGSGKSYTLAKLYHKLFKRFASTPGFAERSQFVLVDFNGEYVDRPPEELDGYGTAVITGEEFKVCYSLSTRGDDGDRLPMPRGAVTDPIFWTVLLDATEKTQAPFIARVLRSDYWDRKIANEGELLHVVADLVLRATISSDMAVDRQTPANLLQEIHECLGDNSPQALDDLIHQFRSNLKFHGKNQTYYWETPAGSKYANEEMWPDFIQSKITSLDIEFTSITDVDRVRFKIVLQYYRDVISGHANREHLGPLISRLKNRVPDIKKLVTISDQSLTAKPLTIVSLRNVNLAMRKVIPMVLCKQLYEAKKVDDPDQKAYLNLIIDEAHNILSTQSSRESDAWRDYRLETFEEIIKEGRKFGVFLTIASQRPHDISETIISQLHNYFLHRLVNNLDVHAIEKAVAYLDAVSFESLPILATGTCVLAGVSAQVPVIVKIGELPASASPNSRTMSVATEWLRLVDLPADGLSEQGTASRRGMTDDPEDDFGADVPS